jgi:FK506-binding protein 4/5
VLSGHFCPALAKAVKTMKKGEKVLLTVKPQCKSPSNCILAPFFCTFSELTPSLVIRYINNILVYLLRRSDGFGEQGRPASGDEGAVPPNATLHIDLELVSWKTVTLIGDRKRILKKVLKEGEGYERPNDGAVVRGV